MQKLILRFFVFLYCISSLLSITLSPCAKWNTTGITVAGFGGPGSNANQLHSPNSIFIHEKIKRLYVSDSMNSRIQVFPLDRSTTTGLSVISNIVTCNTIYVDNDNDDFPTIYVTRDNAKHAEKWMKGATNGAQIGPSCRGCAGIRLDKDKNMYISDYERHIIYKWSPVTNTSTIIAGESDTNGPRSDHLTQPRDIFIDRITGALYVSDVGNNRVQKWPKTSLEGVTVVGSSDGVPGSDQSSLNKPHGLFVDEEINIVYVVDSMNSRIQRWKHGETEGDTIVGGNGNGKENNQLNHPMDLAFDSHGNLFVSDYENHRVQFFALISNRSCQASLTTTVPISTTTVSTSTITVLTSTTTEQTSTASVASLTDKLPIGSPLVITLTSIITTIFRIYYDYSNIFNIDRF